MTANYNDIKKKKTQLYEAPEITINQPELVSGRTCAGRHDGHGFSSSEEAAGSRRGEQGEVKEREKSSPLDAVCSSFTAKLKAEKKAANRKNIKIRYFKYKKIIIPALKQEFFHVL